MSEVKKKNPAKPYRENKPAINRDVKEFHQSDLLESKAHQYQAVQKNSKFTIEKATSEELLNNDIVSENIHQMRQLFPEIFSENGVNFETLRQLLGDKSILDEGEEKYGLNWHGKKKARQIALTPSTSTLLPCPEESLDWDTTKNLFIEGDNLEVLKLLQKSYANKVDVIYIDPPYNTGQDFVYSDKYTEGLETYLKYTGQKSERNKWVVSESGRDRVGRKHSNWFSMMYPRLKLARSLLSSDGVMFISIDDNEVGALTSLCSEIFGEENYVANLVWEKKKKGAYLSGTVTNIKEYVLVYSKSKCQFKGLIGEVSTDKETYPVIKTTNNRATRVIKKGISSKYKELNHRVTSGTRISAGNMEMILKSDLVIEGGVLKEDVEIDSNWIYSQSSLDEYAADRSLYLTQDLYLRRVVNGPREKKIKDILPRVGIDCAGDAYQHNENLFVDGWGTNEDANDELHRLFGVQNVFQFTKPSKLIAKLLYSVRKKEGLVLDFFAGSGTTGHAVQALNSISGFSLRYILVQLPELIDQSKKEQKVAFDYCSERGIAPNISELSKDRLRKVNLTLKAKKDSFNGFKVLKLQSSNIREWSLDRADIEESLVSQQEHLIKGRTEQEVLYELLLKRGLDLVLPIKRRKVAGKNIYSAGGGILFACLNKSILKEEVEEIAQGIVIWLGELTIGAETHVFFRDSAFRDDISKTNMAAILKQNGIAHVRSL